ncbi:hypothetical protein LPJ66_002181 [Kickxella alabastrina]|uniref:Uncharacterized protein n=1 Tax=Kickxella alabastrina TaxID=61397 RepID=A0ACC1IR97_9FUNG|nr:hypothetical protein LPJ66_002181 [Kickxella alabastrina]
MGNQHSFSLTESELNRVEYGKSANITVDPRGKPDMIMLIFFSAIYCFDFLVLAYMLWNRKYPPIKSKNPILMTILMLISMVWFVGDLQSNGHVPLANTLLTNCKAFGLWMRILLGACSVFALTALRAYGLYRVFYLNLPYHSLGLYLPVAIYCLILLGYGIIAQALKSEKTTFYNPSYDLCSLNKGFKTSLFVLLGITWFLLMAVHWKIRNIKSSFNESREMITNGFIMFAVLIFSLVINFKYPTYPMNRIVRILATSIDHVGTHLLWWLIMAVPIYNCMFNRQRYLSHWINKLRKDGLQKEYNVDSDAIANNGHESLLQATTGGNKDGGLFYATDNYMCTSNVTDFRNTVHNDHSVFSENTAYTGGGLARGFSSRSPAAGERH